MNKVSDERFYYLLCLDTAGTVAAQRGAQHQQEVQRVQQHHPLSRGQAGRGWHQERATAC